jgi:hypothetical protein
MVSGGSQNYWGNGSDGVLNTSGDVTLPSTLDGDMVVRNYISLTINAGHTLTVANRCKGLVIYVRGDCTINGTLSMTWRGAHADASAAGDSNGTPGLKFPRFTATGADTYTAPSTVSLANAGAAIIAAEANQKRINESGTVYTIARYGSGGKGGDGFNAITVVNELHSGKGAMGTCFSGGSGGGAAFVLNPGSFHQGIQVAPGANGAPNGGPGGAGGGGGGSGAGGGAGNPGGITLGYGENYQAANGTGGTIILFVKGNLIIGSSGKIESKGGNGGLFPHLITAMGGGSGGGPILVLYGGSLTNNGVIQSVGGNQPTDQNATIDYNLIAVATGGSGMVVVEKIKV